MAYKEKRLTWKQIKAWGWGPRRGGVFSWVNAKTGRRTFQADRVGRCESEVRKAYGRAGRGEDILEPCLTVLHGNTKYLVDPQPITHCRKCGRETWVLTILGRCDDCKCK